MGFEIKQLQDNNPDLIKKLVAIEEEAFGPGGLNEWGLPPLIYHGAVYIIEVDSNPAGIIEYLRDMEEVKTAYLYGLAVKEEYRGKGWGKKLLAYSLKEIKKKDVDKVELTVDPANKKALNLYQDFNFSRKDFRSDEYGPGEDRLIMEKEL